MNTKSSVAIITGIPPINLARLGDRGISSVILPRLFSMFGKDKFHFSGPTIGPATIASYLRQNGIETVIFDYYFDEIKVQDCDIVGISSTFMEPEDIKKIAQDIKSQNPSVSIVMGGPLSWEVSPTKLLDLIPEISCIVLKEGRFHKK